MLHENLNAVHPTSSLIGTNHWRILKNPQNGLFKDFWIFGFFKNPQKGFFKGFCGFFKGIFSSVLTEGTQMKLMKRKFRQWWNSNIYQKFLSWSSTLQFFTILWPKPTGMFEIAYSRLCIGKLRKQTTVEKMDRCS